MEFKGSGEKTPKSQRSYLFPLKGIEHKGTKRRLAKYIQGKSSTKGERRIEEILKKNKIKFLFREKIDKRYEVDFLIGKLALEVDGKMHQDNPKKDIFLFSKGYTPVHLNSYFSQIEKELLKFISTNSRDKTK